MAADLHDELRGSTGQKFIGAKGTAAGVGGDPGIFWFGGQDILVALFVGSLYRGIDAGQLPDFFDIPV